MTPVEILGPDGSFLSWAFSFHRSLLPPGPEQVHPQRGLRKRGPTGLIPWEAGADGAVWHERTSLSFHGCFMEDLWVFLQDRTPGNSPLWVLGWEWNATVAFLFPPPPSLPHSSLLPLLHSLLFVPTFSLISSLFSLLSSVSSSPFFSL